MTKIFFHAAAILVGSLALVACGHSNSSSPLAANAFGDTDVAMAKQTPAVAAALDIGALTGANASQACALDQVNGKGPSDTFTVDGERALSFRGWVVDANNAAAREMTLVLKGAQTAYGLAATTGRSRPDVAKALDSTAAGSAGYEFRGNLKQVPAGTYRALVWVKDPSSDVLCDTGRKLVVTH